VAAVRDYAEFVNADRAPAGGATGGFDLRSARTRRITPTTCLPTDRAPTSYAGFTVILPAAATRASWRRRTGAPSSARVQLGLNIMLPFEQAAN